MTPLVVTYMAVVELTRAWKIVEAVMPYASSTFTRTSTVKLFSRFPIEKTALVFVS